MTGGWQVTNLALPTGTNFYVRARGFARGEHLNGSESVIESVRLVYLKDNALLTIQSPYGVGAPPAGVYTNLIGAILTNTMSSPVTQGATQYVCAGWTMVGNEPASGVSTQLIMTVTNDATLTWLWTTNYWLTTAAGAHGSVIPTNSWQSFGSNVSITATADPYYHFTNWTGDVSGENLYTNPLNLLMDRPKS